MTDPFAVSTVEPVALMIGDYAAWSIPDEIDPTLYTMAAVFDGTPLAGEYDTTDGLWTFTATGAFTGALTAGRVPVDLVVTRISDSAKRTLRSFEVQVFSTPADRRSHARIMVDKIESILSGRADSDVASYTIKNRSITKLSVKELTEWRDYYIAELGSEPDPFTGQRKVANTIKVGFI